MKKIMGILLASVLMLTACGGGGDADKAKEPESGTDAAAEQTEDKAVEGLVGLSVSTLNNPFFVSLTEGAESKAKDLGIDLNVVDAGDDAAKQISDVEDLISKDIKVLIINPVDSDAISAVVQDAVDAGIKVISVDRAVNGVDVDSAIASDNVAGARLAAEYLVSLVGEGADVAELEGVSGTSAAIDRGQGFNEVASESLNVVAKQTANFNRVEGLTVMENILQSQPDLKGVFAHNDEMALGALEAIDSAGKDVVVVGFDATDDAVKAVEDGTMAATVAQKPALMGETSVEVAGQLLKGESVEAVIGVEVELVTK